MPGLIIDGREELIPGLEIINYKDDRRLKLKPGEDMRARHTRWIRSIVWHNTKNIPTIVKDGMGPNTNLEHRIANLWATDGRHAGAHLSVDWDGTICCHADLLQDAAYHAGSINEYSIGGELFEDSKGTVYRYQLDVAARLTLWMCGRFGIQLQMPDPTYKTTITRIAQGGKYVVGVFGHCHNTNRKPDDPSKDIFNILLATDKFKLFNFDILEDIKTWKVIQGALGLYADGIPGPTTCDTLRSKGFKNGLYDWNINKLTAIVS
jgi:hypothetical protein